MVCSVEYNQKVNQDFEVYGVKYQLDMKQLDDLSLHAMTKKSKHHDPLSLNYS